MKSTFLKTLSFAVTLLGYSQIAMAELSEQEALDLATEAYVYGYPLITMDMTKKVMTNVVSPENNHAPVGQFMNAKQYPDPSFKDVTAPNADTLYSTAWLDLSKEPYVLELPNEKKRYYLMPMLSGWTEVFAVPGTRTTGTKAQKYAITGPNWQGKLPKGLKELKSPTNMVWILGRTYCTGTPEDYKAVHELQSQYKLYPLSAYGKDYTPPNGVVDPNVDMKTPVRDQVNSMDAASYFKRLAELMKENPPTKEDAPMVVKLNQLGITPGKDFDPITAEPSVKKAFEQAVQKGQNAIQAQEKNAGVEINGWMYTTKTGHYGTDYLQRALTTAIGLGANLPEDAVYPTTWVDRNIQTLNAKNRYVLHFAKGQTPPVKGFWSLTLYNDKYFFSENPLNRYTLSPRNALKYNPDGSLDLYIQHASPGKDKESNWLPAPQENFVLMLRLYWPKASLLEGKWSPPGVEKLK